MKRAAPLPSRHSCHWPIRAPPPARAPHMLPQSLPAKSSPRRREQTTRGSGKVQSEKTIEDEFEAPRARLAGDYARHHRRAEQRKKHTQSLRRQRQNTIYTKFSHSRAQLSAAPLVSRIRDLDNIAACMSCPRAAAAASKNNDANKIPPSLLPPPVKPVKLLHNGASRLQPPLLRRTHTIPPSQPSPSTRLPLLHRLALGQHLAAHLSKPFTNFPPSPPWQPSPNLLPLPLRIHSSHHISNNTIFSIPPWLPFLLILALPFTPPSSLPPAPPLSSMPTREQPVNIWRR